MYLSSFSPNAGKYGPEKTPYLDTFHAVTVIMTTSIITIFITQIKTTKTAISAKLK